jgi:16S rRNA (uracil1498-N3)-methyltransferase
MTRRFFVENLFGITGSKSDLHSFPKDVEHRLSSVLRMKEGDVFELIDGNGLIIEASYHKNRNHACFRILTQHTENRKPLTEISLAVSIIRRERFELLIEKSVELGVNSLYPIYSEYSKPYGHESPGKLQDRWQKIADQTLSQCRRTFRARINEPRDISSLSEIKDSFDVIIALHPGYDNLNSNYINSAAVKKGKILLLVGPEGGFSDKDLLQIKGLNTKILSLDTDILRTETAVIYMLSVLDYIRSKGD